MVQFLKEHTENKTRALRHHTHYTPVHICMYISRHAKPNRNK